MPLSLPSHDSILFLLLCRGCRSHALFFSPLPSTLLIFFVSFIFSFIPVLARALIAVQFLLAARFLFCVFIVVALLLLLLRVGPVGVGVDFCGDHNILDQGGLQLILRHVIQEELGFLFDELIDEPAASWPTRPPAAFGQDVCRVQPAHPSSTSTHCRLHPIHTQPWQHGERRIQSSSTIRGSSSAGGRVAAAADAEEGAGVVPPVSTTARSVASDTAARASESVTRPSITSRRTLSMCLMTAMSGALLATSGADTLAKITRCSRENSRSSLSRSSSASTVPLPPSHAAAAIWRTQHLADAAPHASRRPGLEDVVVHGLHDHRVWFLVHPLLQLGRGHPGRPRALAQSLHVSLLRARFPSRSAKNEVSPDRKRAGTRPPRVITAASCAPGTTRAPAGRGTRAARPHTRP
mmetsp:Transcript_27067/g.87456  ORF Transcript_27067/g.87456 Transcript_27067/m.87456 type:complete len:409 (-) Transcript_27067:552-1778(-)